MEKQAASEGRRDWDLSTSEGSQCQVVLSSIDIKRKNENYVGLKKMCKYNIRNLKWLLFNDNPCI